MAVVINQTQSSKLVHKKAQQSDPRSERPAIRATRDQSDPRSDRPARAAWAVQRLLAALVRSTAAPSRLVNLVGGDDGARAFGANADDDVAAAAAAAPVGGQLRGHRKHAALKDPGAPPFRQSIQRKLTWVSPTLSKRLLVIATRRVYAPDRPRAGIVDRAVRESRCLIVKVRNYPSGHALGKETCHASKKIRR